MNFVTMGNEKVSVASAQDAKSLMRALSEFNCKVPLSRQDVIGKTCSFDFFVVFNNEEDAIATSTLEDAERIAHWLLDLSCKEITIKRSENDA